MWKRQCPSIWRILLLLGYLRVHSDFLWRHGDVIKWKHFPRYWPFLRGIHRSPVNSPHKSQWRGALMFSAICAWINGWVNNGEAGDLRHHRAHYDVTVMVSLWNNALPEHRCCQCLRKWPISIHTIAQSRGLSFYNQTQCQKGNVSVSFLRTDKNRHKIANLSSLVTPYRLS